MKMMAVSRLNWGIEMRIITSNYSKKGLEMKERKVKGRTEDDCIDGVEEG
jgi:hypothetical protein